MSAALEQEAREEVEPNIAPRGVLDFAVCSSCAVLQFFVLCWIPGMLTYWIASSLFAAVGVGVACLVVFSAHVVTRLDLSDAGIHFVRKFGGPRLIKWDELEGVSVVPPSEIILWGWLLPPFPAREMSPSFSMHGHVAFRWHGRTVYFPPKDPGGFVSRVNASHGSPRLARTPVE